MFVSRATNALSRAKEALSIRLALKLVDAYLQSSDDEFLQLLKRQLDEASRLDQRSDYWAYIIAETIRSGVTRWEDRSEQRLLAQAFAKDAFRLALVALVSKRLAEAKKSKRALRPK